MARARKDRRRSRDKNSCRGSLCNSIFLEGLSRWEDQAPGKEDPKPPRLVSRGLHPSPPHSAGFLFTRNTCNFVYFAILYKLLFYDRFIAYYERSNMSD